MTGNENLFLYVFSFFISHVIEERCEHTEDSSGHTCKEEQLLVEEASYKSNKAPPPPPAPIRSGLLCTQHQGDGQSICNGVDLHVNGQTIEYGCPHQMTSWKERVKGREAEYLVYFTNQQRTHNFKELRCTFHTE